MDSFLNRNVFLLFEGLGSHYYADLSIFSLLIQADTEVGTIFIFDLPLFDIGEDS